jgi:predicted lipoprotein
MAIPQAVRLACGVLIASGLLYYFPLFRIRTIGTGAAPASSSMHTSGALRPGQTSPVSFADLLETLWSEQLPAAVKNAASVEDVLALASTDVTGARKKYGRQIALGGPAFIWVKGTGRIESINEDECRLVVAGQRQRVTLEIGILFGNAVRDSTGLIKAEDFPNSVDFNRLSNELNSRCESLVIQPVRHQLVVGADVEFSGCGEVRDDNGFNPLKLVPVQLKVLADRGSP